MPSILFLPIHRTVGYKDRTGRTTAGDNSAEWLQPACHEMYRVLKNDSLMVSFYARTARICF